MNSQIPFGEAWLLETLVMGRVPVWRLAYGEQSMRDWLNRGYHYLSLVGLKQTLHRLFDVGDIEACLGGGDLGFKPTDSQLEDALQKRDERLLCGATPQGGQRWEILAIPDWSLYCMDYGWDGEFVTIIAGSQQRLVELIDASELFWGVYMDLASLQVQVIRPWRALHWKTLPEGFRAVVPYEKVRVPFLPPDMSREEAEAENRRSWLRYVELHSWATSICGNDVV